jgi:tetratricopeptide (TPR) repeat protein
MLQQLYNDAYNAYQQAVYRDGRNPTFWCSIGVLYYKINQFPDALDAYGRAIRLNPYISEVWYDLGTLYESCENQVSDALDAYTKALELDPNNNVIKTRLEALKALRPGQAPLPALPPVQPAPLDMNSSKFATGPSGSGPPPLQPAQQLGHAPRGSGPMLRMNREQQGQAEKRYKPDPSHPQH